MWSGVKYVDMIRLSYITGVIFWAYQYSDIMEMHGHVGMNQYAILVHWYLHVYSWIDRIKK